MDVYQVDLQSDNLLTNAKLGQGGSVLINDNIQVHSTMVPAWAVLSHNYVWVLHNDQPLLKKVTVGKTYGSYTEVKGLSDTDKIIVGPENIAKLKYQLL